MVGKGKACALALALVVAACGGDDDDVSVLDAEAETSTTATESIGDQAPSAEPEEAAEETQDAAAEAASAQEGDVGEPPVFANAAFLADAPVSVAPLVTLEEGGHRILSVGTELSFTVAEPLMVQPNFLGQFVLTDTSSRGPDDQDIVFLRTSELSDPTQPWQPRDEQTPWPANDLAGWVENLADGVIATDPVETTLGGRDAVYTEISLAGDVECGYDQGTCVGFAENHDFDFKALQRGSLYRVWAVDQGDEDPIFVTVAVLGEDNNEWFDRAEAVLATLAFGETEANPVRQLPAGPSELDALGGVELSFPEEQVAFQLWNGRPFWSTEFNSGNTSIDFAAEVRTLDGELFTASDDLLASLDETSIEMTEVEPVNVGGVEARAFDYTASDPRSLLFTFSELDLQSDFYGWEPASAGRLWLIEHPERGLQAISAKSFGDVDSTLPEVLMIAEGLIASIEYIEVG